MRPVGAYGRPPAVVERALAIYAEQGASEAARYAGVTTRTIVRWGKRAGVRSGYTAPRQTFEHGTTSRYAQGCRCVDCREANTARRRPIRGHNPRPRPTFKTLVCAGCGEPFRWDKTGRPPVTCSDRCAKTLQPVTVPVSLIASVRPDWHRHAACKGLTHLFFATHDPDESLGDNIADSFELTKRARAVCATCPVRVECLTSAMDNSERHGVWGGTTVKERQRLRKVSA